jgi:transposase-like protein
VQRKTKATPAQIRIAVLKQANAVNLHGFIKTTVSLGSTLYTDDWPGYNGLDQWYNHQTICHSGGLYAEDRDGDGYAEVHCNTAEGEWSLLRHCLRSHRGIRKDRLHYYVKSFEYFQNMDLASSYDKVNLYLKETLRANFNWG